MLPKKKFLERPIQSLDFCEIINLTKLIWNNEIILQFIDCRTFSFSTEIQANSSIILPESKKRITKKRTRTSVRAFGSLFLMTWTIAMIPPQICSAVWPWLLVPTHSTTTYKKKIEQNLWMTNVINCSGVNTLYLNFITNLKSLSFTTNLRLIIINKCDHVFYILQWLGPLGWCYPVHRCSVSTAHAVLHHHPHQNSGHEVERTAVAISVNNKKLWSRALYTEPQTWKCRVCFTPNWCMSWIRESPTNRTSGSLSLLSDTKRWCYK